MAKSELFYKCTDKYCTSQGREFQVEVDAKGEDITKCPTCGADAVVLDVQPVKGSGIKKSKPNYNKLGVIVGAVVVVIALVLFFIIGGDDAKDNKVAADVVKVATPVETPNVEKEPVVTEEEEAVPVEEKPAVEEKKPKVQKASAPKGTQTLTFSGGSKYKGEVKDGKMHGLGTYYYGQKERISKKDLKKRMAEKGDYIVGEFYNGKLVSGKLYDSSNNLKEIIMVGR